MKGALLGVFLTSASRRALQSVISLVSSQGVKKCPPPKIGWPKRTRGGGLFLLGGGVFLASSCARTKKTPDTWGAPRPGAISRCRGMPRLQERVPRLADVFTCRWKAPSSPRARFSYTSALASDTQDSSRWPVLRGLCIQGLKYFATEFFICRRTSKKNGKL